MPGFFYPGWDAVKLLFEGVKVFRWIEIKEIQEQSQFDVILEWIGLARDISFGCGVQRPSGMFIGNPLLLFFHSNLIV